MFQLGICQLLGQFAVDTRWELEARQSAVAFLGALYQIDGIWKREKDVDQVIFDVLTKLASSNDTHFEAAKILLEEMRNQNTALKQIANPHSQPWNNIQPRDLTWHTPPEGILLKAVQKKLGPDMEEIQSALKTHYAKNEKLSILRVSGDPLPLETCFVNLAIVEAPAQREKEKQDVKKQATIFHRIPGPEVVRGANLQSSILLEQLFDKRKLRHGMEDVPKRILVQGRAGIGKTTLCKMLVYAHQTTGLWKDRFDAVLWIPLRRLRASTSSNLQDLVSERYFSTVGSNEDRTALSRALVACADRGRVLFVLDGLDEFVTDPDSNVGERLETLLDSLLTQQHVVITSRPSGLDKSLLRSIDLDLETIGFSQQNVNEFLVKVLKEPGAVAAVQDFIRRTPLIQGLVNIPVQLDVICLCWDDDGFIEDDSSITMTKLYQHMVRNLWRKDADRLNKERGGARLTKKHLNEMDREEIDELMNIEVQHLGYLAFKGMTNNYQIGFHQADLIGAFKDLKAFRTTLNNDISLPQLVDEMKETSFLHTPETDLDPHKQAWNFLHLTFQEYFAATWIAQKLRLDEPYLSAGAMKAEPTIAFVHKHKYNPRYEIVWWMVAGLLEGRALEKFFDLLQEASSRDLIGGRHQQILASCLDEARARLAPDLTAELDGELMKWLQFEIQTNPSYGRSMLGSQTAFPETLLIQSFGSVCRWKPILVRTMGVRSIFSKSALQFLISTLKDEDSEVRNSAVSALGKLSTLSDSAIQSLIDALKDEDAYVRSSAASALGSQSTLSELAIQSLTDVALQYEDPDLMDNAAFALGRQSTLSESAMGSLIHALRYGDTSMRYSALSALDNSSTLSIQFFTDEIGNDWVDPEVRMLAASVLGQRSMLPESTIQSLIGALKDYDTGVRQAAASALLKQSMLPESATRLAIQSLIEILKDEHAYVRTSAASVLSEQSTLPELAIRSLIGALMDDDAGVRMSAASALGKQPTLPESAIQSLIDALKDYNTGVRTSVASALGKRSTLSNLAIQSLIDALKDEDAGVRMSAASALGKRATLSELAIQSLIGALKDEDAGVRTSAASTLLKQAMLLESAIRLSVQSLIGALKDGDASVRWSAAEALGKQPSLPESAIQSLIDALKDYNTGVRKSAASVLGKRATLSELAIQSLIGALKDEDAYVRSSAASALGSQSTLSESAIQSLIGALKDEHQDVSRSAASALENQCHSLFIALPSLSEDEMTCVYKDHLFPYSCRRVFSLQVQHGKLHCYTEKGLVPLEYIEPDKLQLVISTFTGHSTRCKDA
ncbi:hypothetical protein BGZ94_003774 [Podila epigama]|nr:hypothetical protein BGZ94_003774 [Podila epigama]